MEKSGRLRMTRAERASEADDSVRDDTQASDIDEEDVMISRAQLKGFTQALAGAVQMLTVVVRKFKLDKGKDEGIREIGNLIKGILSSLEQCGEQKARSRKRRREPIEVERNVTRVMETREMTVDKGGYPKRKVVSPAEIMRRKERRRPRKGEVTYAEACTKDSRDLVVDRDCSEDSEGWTRVERRKRERRAPLVQDIPVVQPSTNGEVASEGRGAPRSRRKKEAILVKVEEGSDRLQVYKRIIAARSTLEGATGVRRTRAGHILIEFDRTVMVNEAVAKLRAALSDSTEVAALVNRATLQIRNIDPLTSKEELVEDIRSQWGIEENVDVEVKSIKAAPWGTQVAVVVLPASGVPSHERERGG